MQKILVIGAAGGTGSALVEQALAAGHQVTAYVHDASKYTQAGVRVVEGDALNQDQVEAAVAGQDAVFDALGPHQPYQTSTLESNAAQNIVEAMQKHGVRRLVVVSMLGQGDSKNNATFLYEKILMPTFLRGTTKDKAGAEFEVQSSNLDWVIVRPPMLVDGEAKGHVKVISSHTDEKAHKITRKDLATFLLQQLTSDTYLHQAVTIANE